MKNAVKNIMVRAINKRMAAGEKFEDVIKSYPRLTAEDTEQIKECINDISKGDGE